MDAPVSSHPRPICSKSAWLCFHSAGGSAGVVVLAPHPSALGAHSWLSIWGLFLVLIGGCGCLGRSLGCSFQGQHHARCSVAHPLKSLRCCEMLPLPCSLILGTFISDAQLPPSAPVSRAVPEFQCSASLLSRQPVTAACIETSPRAWATM